MRPQFFLLPLPANNSSQSKQSFTVQFLSKPLFKLLFGSLVLSSLALLTGCWQVTVVKPAIETSTTTSPYADILNPNSNVAKQTLSEKEKSAQVKQQEKAQQSKKKASNSTSKPATNSQNKHKIKQEHRELLPVSSNHNTTDYDVESWNKDKISPLNIHTVAENPEALAKIISIDENSLDFASDSAIKYRFTTNDTPYLDMVNSNNYLEIGWQFANTEDNANVKKISARHARKAYRFARQLMGDEGGQVVLDMLSGKVIKNKQVNGINIALAKCEFYSCMLVMEKPKSTTPTAISEKDSKDKQEAKANTSKLADKKSSQ